VKDGVAVVEALYELPAVKATLALTYRINGAGGNGGDGTYDRRQVPAEVPQSLLRYGMTRHDAGALRPRDLLRPRRT